MKNCLCGKVIVAVLVGRALVCVGRGAEGGLAGAGRGGAAALRFVADGKQFLFDTGSLRGILRQGDRSAGLAEVVEAQSGVKVSASLGLFSHYRLLDADARYGPAAWDWKSDARLLPDGSVEARWAADEKHPFDLAVLYRFSSANALDVTSTVTVRKDLRKFESFLASYFAGFDQSFVYAKDADGARFVPTPIESGAWQMFPRDDDAVKIIRDGRWRREPNPVDWTIRPQLAGALAMRRDGKTGLTALVMARPEDCFAISTPYSGEGHRSLYLSLFGRDLKAGATATARSRLVIGREISEKKAVEMYEAYVKGAQ